MIWCEGIATVSPPSPQVCPGSVVTGKGRRGSTEAGIWRQIECGEGSYGGNRQILRAAGYSM